ncbi:biotin/lipoyl-binding protein [Cryobacterium sp. TMT1-3]|uniref:biotin carboxylase n=1 Tax=Cryobacterium luteum TaxID=1424661 RepID=A0A1H8KVQ7_9MICO|nr:MULTISPECIES: biotin carboxylase N-terminal domain-containing protein [Cryobacterium]TFB87777.1 biotin/lipoyl-binding protein [Cryobacterium luteum]TFC30611.1 biotin/lipoyl-binding protein [Cryobacterium sp. TMT1-3]SEN96676.1 acetyl-CoA/propionyl-CoA carboxylase, biotin carboxylase, biotin carboxyl carrier protein [Cryobacterium luteum]
MTTLFDIVLVANRGEIACRILRTLRERGIRSVAVYSDADRGARHVQQADAAVRIGPAAPAESYLSIDAILAAAAQTGAQAIHPGYGFLSENQAFARACADAGIVFIGPSVNALAVMGDKIRSKNHVAGFGVPIIPGIARPGLSDEQLTLAAAEVGYPLLIKPSAGGGGKGMEIVESADQLADALRTARRVAANAFGDDTLFLERLVSAPRHIEVQVLADNYGAVIHLGERECSLQRRHQKVIEEAPSPLLDAATRARIGEAACAAARSVDYRGAGTVEFLVAADAPDEFFFMEMNTRLQVEHPVTELVTGVDLVDWQLRIAAGEPLGLAQSDICLNGHAIEARVYAENPTRDFLPMTGTVLTLREAVGDGIRVDSALLPGLQIGGAYDPMLAKVVAWGPDRATAIARLERALADTLVLGVQTNLEYLRLLLHEPMVRAGQLDTGLIERTLPHLAFRQADDHVLAAAALLLHADANEAASSSWQRPSGWRLGEHRPARYELKVGRAMVSVAVLGEPGAASVRVGDAALAVGRFAPIDAGRVRVEFAGETRVYDLARTTGRLYLGHDGVAFDLGLPSRAEHLAEQLAGRDRVAGALQPEVRSPMPGTVVAVPVTSGDRVIAGQTLATIEAMKMEHKLVAPHAGTVTISVAPGELVCLDQIVATVTPDATTTPDQGDPQ